MAATDQDIELLRSLHGTLDPTRTFHYDRLILGLLEELEAKRHSVTICNDKDFLLLGKADAQALADILSEADTECLALVDAVINVLLCSPGTVVLDKPAIRLAAVMRSQAFTASQARRQQLKG